MYVCILVHLLSFVSLISSCMTNNKTQNGRSSRKFQDYIKWAEMVQGIHFNVKKCLIKVKHGQKLLMSTTMHITYRKRIISQNIAKYH